MASNAPGKCCTVGTLHRGQPTGKSIKIDDNTEAYLAIAPEGIANKGIGILYLPDVLGLWNNSKLMADQFAANGYTTLIPDLFNGDILPYPIPKDLYIMDWINNGANGNNPHTPTQVDPVVIKAIKVLKDLLKEQGTVRIGAVGYCFGAKYVVRNYKQGINVGYVGHPSFISEDELAAITGPLSIAAAQTDSIFPAELRYRSEEILIETGKPFQINLFSGVEHGFAVRGDPDDPAQRFAKEQAFFQALQWFNNYLALKK